MRDGRVLAIEGAEGTDGMLHRGWLEAARSAGRRGGVLVKGPEARPGAARRHAGDRAAHRRAAAAAGLAGIAVERAAAVLVVDRADAIERADAAGLFVAGCRGCGPRLEPVRPVLALGSRSAACVPTRAVRRDIARGAWRAGRGLQPFGDRPASWWCAGTCIAIEQPARGWRRLMQRACGRCGSGGRRSRSAAAWRAGGRAVDDRGRRGSRRSLARRLPTAALPASRCRRGSRARHRRSGAVASARSVTWPWSPTPGTDGRGARTIEP